MEHSSPSPARDRPLPASGQVSEDSDSASDVSDGKDGNESEDVPHDPSEDLQGDAASKCTIQTRLFCEVIARALLNVSHTIFLGFRRVFPIWGFAFCECVRTPRLVAYVHTFPDKKKRKKRTKKERVKQDPNKRRNIRKMINEVRRFLLQCKLSSLG